MDDQKKRGRPRKDEANALKALVYMYWLLHAADFIMDKHSQRIMEMMASNDEAQMIGAASYLEKRHKAIDHLLATAKPKEKPDGSV